jgi:hypothetical protein
MHGIGRSGGATTSSSIWTQSLIRFLPMNGLILALSIHPEVEGRLLSQNLTNKPLFVVNGGKGPIYPGRRNLTGSGRG